MIMKYEFSHLPAMAFNSCEKDAVLIKGKIVAIIIKKKYMYICESVKPWWGRPHSKNITTFFIILI